MEELKIIGINYYDYELINNIGQIYNLKLEFFDIEKKPQVGNIIYMNKELLNEKYEGYSIDYTFGDMKSEYGKSNISLNDIDVIKIIIDDFEIYLKRLYG